MDDVLVNGTVINSKNVDPTKRLKWTIDRYERNETGWRLEECRIEHDRKVSEEQRAEMGIWRKQTDGGGQRSDR